MWMWFYLYKKLQLKEVVTIITTISNASIHTSPPH